MPEETIEEMLTQSRDLMRRIDRSLHRLLIMEDADGSTVQPAFVAMVPRLQRDVERWGQTLDRFEREIHGVS